MKIQLRQERVYSAYNSRLQCIIRGMVSSRQEHETSHPTSSQGQGDMDVGMLIRMLACLCSALSLHSYTVQEPLPREWYPLGGLGLPTSVSLVKTVPTDTPIV